VGIHSIILALACKSSARFGIAILTLAIPSGPIIEELQMIISAIAVAGSLNKLNPPISEP